MSASTLQQSPITTIKVRYKHARKATSSNPSNRFSTAIFLASDSNRAYYEQRHTNSREDFILDCCKVTINKLPEYNSYKDRNMVNYFTKQPHHISVKDIMYLLIQRAEEEAPASTCI